MRKLLLGVIVLASCAPSQPKATETKPAPVASAPNPEPTPAPPEPTTAATPAPIATSEPLPPTAEPTPPGVAPPEPATSSIDKQVAALRPRLRSCYKKELEIDPSSSGAVKLELTYDANGKMTSAKVLCTTLSKPSTECIRKVFLDVSLDSGPGKMVIGGPC